MVEANNALINLNGKKIPKTEINFRLNWANKHCERNRNLYVGNLPSDLDDIQLFNIFKEKYPSIHHVSIMTDNGESKGYGFIQFINKNDYEKCLKEMDGYFIKGKPIIVKERKKKNFEEKNWNNLNNSYKYNNINIPMVINNANNNNNKKIYNKKNNYNQDINNINPINMSNNEFINKNDYEKCLKEMDGFFISGKPIIVRERKKKNFEEKNWNNLNNTYKYNNINMPMVINNRNNNKKIYNKKNNYNHGINNINVRNMSNNEIINGSNNDYFYKYNNKINPLLFSKEQLNNSNNNNNFEENEDLSSSISSSSNSEKRKFSSNLDLIVNDDHNALNKKIQESVNKMFEHYKYQSKNNEEFNMIVYYGSNKFNFSDDIYFQKL